MAPNNGNKSIEFIAILPDEPKDTPFIIKENKIMNTP